MAKIISFTNQKGGVGKTTSAVNIAASLGVLGKKTLLFDLDPQGNSTSGLGIVKKKLHLTSYDVLLGNCPAKDAITETKFDNLSVIPTNIALSGAEFELFELEDNKTMLKKALSGLDGDFDYIIIDCPPSLGMLTINALIASDGVIIPMQCEFYSLEGLSQLMTTLTQVKKKYNPELLITGILITMYNGRLLLSMQVLSELKRHYGDKLFSTMISRNVKLSEAPSFGVPVYYHDKHAKGSAEYLEVAKELTERI